HQHSQCRYVDESVHLPVSYYVICHHVLVVAEILVVQRALDARMRQAIPAERLQSAREDGAGVGLILDEQDGPGSCAAGSFGAVGDHRWRSYPSGRSKCKPELRAPRRGGRAGQIAAGGLDKSASDDETKAGAVPAREKW